MSTGVGITTSVGALRLRRARAKRCGTDAGAVAGDAVDAAGSAMEVGVRDMWQLAASCSGVKSVSACCVGCQLCHWLAAVEGCCCCGLCLLLLVAVEAGWCVEGNGQFDGSADRLGMVMSVLAQVLLVICMDGGFGLCGSSHAYSPVVCLVWVHLGLCSALAAVRC